LLIFFNIVSYSQNHLNQVISEKDSVLISIEIKNEYFAQLQFQDELEARKYDWLNYLPTPGYTRLNGAEIRYNFTQIYTVLRDRNNRKLRRKELQILAREESKKEQEEYLLLNEELENFQEGIRLKAENLKLEKRLYELAQERYNNNEISTTELISKEIAYSNKLISHRELELRLKELHRKINYFKNLKTRFQSDVH
jgi:hypothetical protein